MSNNKEIVQPGRVVLKSNDLLLVQEKLSDNTKGNNYFLDQENLIDFDDNSAYWESTIDNDSDDLEQATNDNLAQTKVVYADMGENGTQQIPVGQPFEAGKKRKRDNSSPHLQRLDSSIPSTTVPTFDLGQLLESLNMANRDFAARLTDDFRGALRDQTTDIDKNLKYSTAVLNNQITDIDRNLKESTTAINCQIGDIDRNLGVMDKHLKDSTIALNNQIMDIEENLKNSTASLNAKVDDLDNKIRQRMYDYNREQETRTSEHSLAIGERLTQIGQNFETFKNEYSDRVATMEDSILKQQQKIEKFMGKMGKLKTRVKTLQINLDSGGSGSTDPPLEFLTNREYPSNPWGPMTPPSDRDLPYRATSPNRIDYVGDHTDSALPTGRAQFNDWGPSNGENTQRNQTNISTARTQHNVIIPPYGDNGYNSQTNISTPMNRVNRKSTSVMELSKLHNLPRYNGYGTLAPLFLKQVQNIFAMANVTDDLDRINAFSLMISGKISNWFLGEKGFTSWENLKSRFLKQFHAPYVIKRELTKWQETPVRENSDLVAFALEGLRLLECLGPDDPFHKHAEEIIIKLPYKIRESLLHKRDKYETQEELLESIQRALRVLDLQQGFSKPKLYNQNYQNKTYSKPGDKEGIDNRVTNDNKEENGSSRDKGGKGPMVFSKGKGGGKGKFKNRRPYDKDNKAKAVNSVQDTTTAQPATTQNTTPQLPSTPSGTHLPHTSLPMSSQPQPSCNFQLPHYNYYGDSSLTPTPLANNFGGSQYATPPPQPMGTIPLNDGTLGQGGSPRG